MCVISWKMHCHVQIAHLHEINIFNISAFISKSKQWSSNENTTSIHCGSLRTTTHTLVDPNM
jgi:hypothetical protein